MLFRLKRDVYYRRYDGIGYLVNKRTSRDRVVNVSGAIFLEALGRTGRPISEITEEISARFLDPPPELGQDILDFYSELEQDGFLVSGKTEEQLNDKDHSHYYRYLDPESLSAGRPVRRRPAGGGTGRGDVLYAAGKSGH